jgi:hypothetical protein
MAPGRRAAVVAVTALAALAASLGLVLSTQGAADAVDREYPWHRDIVATVFWVGEVFDSSAIDGSQVVSAYDSNWMNNYGGCDGVLAGGTCQTEPRDASNGYFPRNMTPRQNPFYLDLPFDDINNDEAFARRGAVIPWANDPGYAGRAQDRGFSFMKNRWVQMEKGGHVCYGQIQDAGPGEYNDAAYVFGADNRRPANSRFNGAGMDVSPALAGCLGFQHLNGSQEQVNWRFIEEQNVPNGPWRKIVTTSPVVPF